MMQRIQFLWMVVFIGSLLLGGIFYLWLSSSEKILQAVPQDKFLKSEEEADIIIRRVDGGYEPNTVTITKGQKVLWINESSEFHWPASNIHPTHTLYPEFDALKPIALHESWAFTFTKVGQWHFHDHLRANKTGLIIVTEKP